MKKESIADLGYIKIYIQQIVSDDKNAFQKNRILELVESIYNREKVLNSKKIKDIDESL